MDVAFEAQTKPLSTLSVFSYIPPRRGGAKENSYFYKVSEAPEVSSHGPILQQAEGYDNKLHRDDRRHSKGRGLNIYEEEKSRAVPVRTSSEYGHRVCPVLYQPGRQHVRVARLQAEVSMKNGIVWNVEEGYGSVAPV
ncbi:cilia- and flagella-associated protein 90 [Genypterus blacodes]|uniref:cilia- and flagella-associated protein 90 n=1 Tax=Genypterus blacodes TaxID=154954 RepID=UPI003F75F35B